MGPKSRLVRCGAGALLALAVWVPTASAFEPAVEAMNFSKGNERSAIYDTPAYQALLRQVSAQNSVAADIITATDPEREFRDHVCQDGMDGCAGDARLYDWQAKGYGIVQPVLWTARSGATISGHVWATKAGPAKRPGIVITNGSVQADEQLYWFAAQALAKAGYVVLTADPQGQGQSDTPGVGPDAGEGVPAQSDGRPFYDGTVDALDFFFSTPAKPFEPRPSCESGTSHADKQDRRVKAGLNAAYNPFYALLDPSRVGLAGHSYGAAGVSYVAQFDPRVKAVVAWDNLAPADPASKGPSGGSQEKPCVDASQRKVVPVTKPGLGMSADYFIPPTPNTSQPDPKAKSTSSLAYSAAGVDTGEIIIRGGTHYDFDWLPNMGFPATLRGADMIAWYTNAWMDKYVKGDATADARLLTDRWRSDAAEGAVDPTHDANMYSFYYPSRLDIRRSGGARFVCEDLRPGCAGSLTPKASDGVAGEFDYLKLDTSPDAAPAAPSVPAVTAGLPQRSANRCTSRRRIVLHARRVRGTRITRVEARVGRRVVGKATTRRLTVRLAGLPKGSAKVVLRLTGRRHGRTVHVTQTRTFHTCAAKRKA